MQVIRTFCRRLNPRCMLAGRRNGVYTDNKVQIPYLGSRSKFTAVLCQKAREKEPGTSLSIQDYFKFKDRNRESFLTACEVFKSKGKHHRGHIEFIYAALMHMEEYGVHKDLELYKALIDLMPKGKMIPTNMFQAEFMHYPKQQHCAVHLLEQMEMHGVLPDTEMEMILRNIFGKNSDPVKKFGRMMYWMPKFKNASPWALPFIISKDAFELAKLAVERMCTVDHLSKITVFETKDVEDAVDDTWIVSGMSPIQEELISKHPVDEPLKVEGPFRIFLREQCVGYFILRGEGKKAPPPPKTEEIDDVARIELFFSGQVEEPTECSAITKKLSVHEQDDGVIMAICATGTSSRDSLLSWIRLLQDSNPNLCNIPVLFTQASPIGDVMTVEEPQPEDKIEATP